MNLRLRHFTRISFFLILVFSSLYNLHADSIAIGVSGGDGRNSDVDNWRKENVEKVCKKLKEIGINNCATALNKDELRSQIRDAVNKLKCGDTLVLFFNGHGDEDKGFVFDKEGSKSPNRFLSAEELLEWLEKLACCVKIYIACHCCYSGDFILKMLGDEHVVVAVSSSGQGEKSHKKPGYNNVLGGFVNRRNWPDGFVGGLNKNGSLAEIFQRAASQGKEHAEEKGGNKEEKYDDEPLDFKRGHIESVEKTPDGLRITLRVGDGTVVIIVPRQNATSVSGLSTDELQECFDVEIGGKANFDKNRTFMPKKLDQRTPVVRIRGFTGKFHIIEVVDRDKKKVKVCFFKPPGLRGETRIIVLDKLPDDIKFCKWYTARARISRDNVISVSAAEESPPEPYVLEAHVIEVDRERGDVIIEIKNPNHLRGTKRKLKLKEGQEIPEWMEPCVLITLEGIVTEEAVAEGEKIDVKRESFRAHVKSIDYETGEIEIDGIESPERLKGQTRKVIVDPKLIPQDITPCKMIVFSGKSYGDEVRDVENLNLAAD